jgi:hypothetical protein
MGRRWGAEDALSPRRCQPGFRALDTPNGGAAIDLRNVLANRERDNTLSSKLLSIDLTLE